MAKINNKPRGKSQITRLKSKGIKDHISKLKEKKAIGAQKKRNIFAELGIKVSFPKSLKPSAKACKSPYKPTTLGPLLLCIAPKTLRSKTVKKAMQSNKGNN